MVRRDIASGFPFDVAACGGPLTGATGICIAIKIGVTDIPARAASVRHIFIRTAIEPDHIGIAFVKARAMKVAAAGEQAAYIEVVTDTYAAPPLPQRLHESTKSLYGVG